MLTNAILISSVNKTRKIRVFLILIVLLFSFINFLRGQQDSRYSYSYEDDTEICIFRNVNYNEVWSAAVKTLVADKYTIQSSDKDTGTINAVRLPKIQLIVTEPAYSISLIVEETKNGIKVSGSCDKVGSLIQMDKEEKEKLLERLFDLMAERLYPDLKKSL